MRRWNLRCIPTSAERFDQLNAGGHLLNAQVDGRLLIAEKRGLGGDHVEVRINSQFVAVRRDLQISFCRRHSSVLLLYFSRENSQRGEIIFHLLKGRQHRLAVVRHGLIILRSELHDRGPAQSAVVNRFRHAGPRRKEPTRPGKPTGE